VSEGYFVWVKASAPVSVTCREGVAVALYHKRCTTGHQLDGEASTQYTLNRPGPRARTGYYVVLTWKRSLVQTG
jgi:hypothetical protein